MSSGAPEVIGHGALVRVAGSELLAGVSYAVHPFLELRFRDGHVERWLAAGVPEVIVESGQQARLQCQRSTTAVINAFPQDVAVKVQRAFDLAEAPSGTNLPMPCVYVEYNCQGPYEPVMYVAAAAPAHRPPRSVDADAVARHLTAGPSDFGMPSNAGNRMVAQTVAELRTRLQAGHFVDAADVSEWLGERLSDVRASGHDEVLATDVREYLAELLAPDLLAAGIDADYVEYG